MPGLSVLGVLHRSPTTGTVSRISSSTVSTDPHRQHGQHFCHMERRDLPKVQQNGGSGSGRGRRARGLRVSTTLAEINVVPLVDVMLVLLIIFMVAAPMMTQGMQVNLPTARRAPAATAMPIYVTIPGNFGQTRIVQLGNEEIRVDILNERMRQLLLTVDDKSVFIRADASVTVQQFMTVTDKLKEAGVEKVAMATQPPGSR